MSPFIKRYLHILTTLLTQVSITTVAMEQQLQPAKKQVIKYVNCSIMIPHDTSQLVAYAMKTVHAAIFEHSNLQSTIKDPIILMHVQKNSAHNNFYAPLPAKLFINCTDGSVLHLNETDGSKLFTSHPVFKKIPLQITATCTKNSNLKGDSFAEQFNNAMNEFYKKPGKPWVDKEHQDELELAGIMTTSILPRPIIMIGPRGPFAVHLITSEHGPNGCPNEQAFIKSMINEKISYSTKASRDKPANKNLFTSLKNREMGNINRQRPHIMTPEELLELQEPYKTLKKKSETIQTTYSKS